MPDVVEFKPVRARRPHRSVRPKLLNIKGLDRRTAARKAFDALVAEIEHDLGGREQLSAIEKTLMQAYAGSAIVLYDLNARVVLGQEIDVGTHGHAARGLEIGWTDAEPLFARHTCKLSVGEVDGPINPSPASLDKVSRELCERVLRAATIR